MKIATMILFMLLCTAAVTAQQLVPLMPVVSGLAAPDARIETSALHSAAAHTDARMPGSLLAIDTLSDHVKRATGIRNYIYRDASNNSYPVIGANTLYIYVGQKFPISGSGRVLSVLLPVSMSRVNGEADTMVVNVFPGGGTGGLPNGSSLGYGRFMTDGVDTSSTQLRFTVVDMETPTDVTGPFVTTVRTRRLSNNDDAFMIWSSNNGDGKGENRACYITVQNNQLVSGNLSSLVSSGGVGIDIDVLIVPVIDGTISDAGNPPTLDGLAFLGVSPQPAADHATVSLRADRDTRVTIDIIDASGRIVSRGSAYDLASGTHALPVDVAGLRPGVYYLRLAHGAHAIATTLHIVR